MKAYMVAFVRVHELEEYNREYLSAAHPLISNFGGKGVIVSNKITKLSGEFPEGKFVVLEFPSVEKAKAYYNCEEHQILLEKGGQYFSSDSIIVENEMKIG